MLSPTRLIPWFSKVEGNTYSALLHHPFLFKEKTNASSRGSIGPRGTLRFMQAKIPVRLRKPNGPKLYPAGLAQAIVVYQTYPKRGKVELVGNFKYLYSDDV